MRLRTWAVAAVAAATGYVFGTRAGRVRFEQLKMRARDVAQDPKVQQNLSNLAGAVAKNAEKINSPVSGVIKSAAEQVQSTLKPEPIVPPAPQDPGVPPVPEDPTEPPVRTGGPDPF